MMKDIEIKINRETRMVDLNKTTIGNEAENLQGNFVFSFSDEFVNGQARLEFAVDSEKEYVLLEKNGETYTMPIKSIITKKGQIIMQLVVTEGADENEIPIFKSNVFYVYCKESINAEIEVPDEYPQWIEIANTKLNQIDNLDIDVEKVGGVATITVTKKDGTQESVEIYDGQGGGTGGTSDYELLNNKPQINGVELHGNKTLDDLGIQPKGNYLTNESDPTVPSYVKDITEEDITNWNNKSEFSGNYNDLTNKPTIPTPPTKTSDLINDSGFITGIPSEYVTEDEMSTAIASAITGALEGSY